jgi:hypothetical protein
VRSRGNAILDVDPDWLIIVEGIQPVGGDSMPPLPLLETAQHHLIRPAKESRMRADEGFPGRSVVRDAGCAKPQP